RCARGVADAGGVADRVCLRGPLGDSCADPRVRMPILRGAGPARAIACHKLRMISITFLTLSSGRDYCASETIRNQMAVRSSDRAEDERRAVTVPASASPGDVFARERQERIALIVAGHGQDQG